MSVAAGLRHSLAVTGKFFFYQKLPQCLFPLSSQSTNPDFLFCLQTPDVYISGEVVF